MVLNQKGRKGDGKRGVGGTGTEKKNLDERKSQKIWMTKMAYDKRRINSFRIGPTN